MKKGIQDKTPFEAFWERVVLDGRIYKVAREYRKGVEIPENGFGSSGEFNIWFKKFKKNKDESALEICLVNFVEKLKKIIPYEGIITEDSFKHIIMEFFIFDKVNDDDLKSLNNSGMSVVIVKDGKRFSQYLLEHGEAYGQKVEDGVYLKIAPFSTVSRIQKYIEDEKTSLRNSLKAYAENVKLKKPKRIKASPHFNRDFMILKIDEMFSKKDIEEKFSIKADYKDMAISSLMNEKVVKGVTPSIVKAVKQRRKIK